MGVQQRSPAPPTRGRPRRPAPRTPARKAERRLESAPGNQVTCLLDSPMSGPLGSQLYPKTPPGFAAPLGSVIPDGSDSNIGGEGAPTLRQRVGFQKELRGQGRDILPALGDPSLPQRHLTPSPSSIYHHEPPSPQHTNDRHLSPRVKLSYPLTNSCPLATCEPRGVLTWGESVIRR